MNLPLKGAPIWDWVDAVVNETIEDDQLAELMARMESDHAARQFYVHYYEMHAGLVFAVQSSRATREAAEKLREQVAFQEQRELETNGDEDDACGVARAGAGRAGVDRM